MVGIYKITNLLNGKCYVGQSININKRWNEHRLKASYENDVSFNSALHSAFRKYGIENFSFEVLEECLDTELDEKEKGFISFYNSMSPNGYNILFGGQSSRKEIIHCSSCGKVISKNTKNLLCMECFKFSLRKAERPEPLNLAKLIKDNGFVKTGEQFGISGNAIVKWCKDYNIPYKKKEIVEWYNNQIGIKEQKPEKSMKNAKRKVSQIDVISKEVIATFESTNEAARAIGKKDGSHISETCNGKWKTAYGFEWQYVDFN